MDDGQTECGPSINGILLTRQKEKHTPRMSPKDAVRSSLDNKGLKEIRI